MIEIFGKLYYIDFGVLDKFLSMEDTKKDTIETVVESVDVNGHVTKKTTTTDNVKQKEINGVKFEIIRNFIDDLGLSAEDNTEDYDSALGSRNLKNMPLRFKLAFNTLVYYNILRKVN